MISGSSLQYRTVVFKLVLFLVRGFRPTFRLPPPYYQSEYCTKNHSSPSAQVDRTFTSRPVCL